MPVPPIPANEAARLVALERYKLLDTSPEEEFDNIIDLTRHILNVPIVLISLVDRDRQWFKACFGLSVNQTDREVAFCAYAILQTGPLIVPNALLDERFAQNPLVTGEPHIRSYAGYPLLTKEGFALGTLCCMDRQPRDFTPDQVELLKGMARTVVSLIEHRLSERRLLKFEQGFREVSFKVLNATGPDLFPALTRYLSQFLDITYTSTSLFLPGQTHLKILSVAKGGQTIPEAVFELSGSPVEKILEQQSFFYTNNLIEDFPRIVEFKQNNLTSFAGTLIRDAQGNSLGLLSVLDTKPLHDIVLIESLLEVVAGRLSAELQRNRLEEELRRSEEQYRLLIRHFPNGLALLFGLDHRIRVAGGSVIKDLGLSLAGVEGRTLLEAFPEYGEMLHQYAGPALSGEVHSFEAPYAGRLFQVQVLPVKNDKGEIFAGMAVSQDITVQHQAEKEIRLALAKEKELRELKSRFISVASHELRNPLTSLLACTEMLEHYSDRLRPEKRAEFFQRIRDSIETMTLLVNDVLIYSKAEENRVEIKSSRISLEAFCRGLVDEFNLINPAESPTVHFEWTCGCTMSNPYVEIDQKLLRHILQNLLSNAIKYAPGTSQVAFVVVCKPGNFWIEIRDQGIGIPAEDLPYLFEPFHRASNTGPISGTGLGLAIVKQYVDLLGGTISVKSEVGQGTVFSLFLECDTSR